MSCVPTRKKDEAQPRFSFKAKLSAHVAKFLTDAISAGLETDDLIDAVNTAFPGITFHDFAGGWHLWRVMSGAPDQELLFPHGEAQ
jgi:hypothetical protein